MAYNFTGKRALVTGAGRGMGRAIALALSKAGAEVFALDVNEENLGTLCQEDPSISTVLVDLADWERTKAAVDQLGHIHLLVNNAGINIARKDILETTKEDILKVMDINLLAAVNVSQVAARKMKETPDGGAIVNISSVCGRKPMKRDCAYDLSKAALDMFTMQMALELGPNKIRVNSVNPTVVMTDLTRANYDSKSANTLNLLSHTPLGRLAEVKNIVDMVLFLLSDHAAMVTGTTNRVDGGLLCNFNV